MLTSRYDWRKILLLLTLGAVWYLSFFGAQHGVTWPQSARAVFPYSKDLQMRVAITHRGAPELQVDGLTAVWLDNVHMFLPAGHYALVGPSGSRELLSQAQLELVPPAEDVGGHVIRVHSEGCRSREVEATDEAGRSFLGLSTSGNQAVTAVRVTLRWISGTEPPCPTAGTPEAYGGFRALVDVAAREDLKLEIGHARPYVLVEGVKVAARNAVVEVASWERAAMKVRKPMVEPIKVLVPQEREAHVTLQFGYQGEIGRGTLAWRGRFSALDVLSGREGGTLILREREVVAIPSGMGLRMALGEGTLMVEMSGEGMRVDAKVSARQIKRGEENLAGSVALLLVEWFRPVEVVVAGGGSLLLAKLLRLRKHLARWLRKSGERK